MKQDRRLVHSKRRRRDTNPMFDLWKLLSPLTAFKLFRSSS
jgi:hypothetical protein